MIELARQAYSSPSFEEGTHVLASAPWRFHPVSFESHPLPADRILALLDQAELALPARLLEDPTEGANRTIATFLAQKPDQR
jgi:hypothetical protein